MPPARPTYTSRTVRIRLDLLARVEAYRAEAEARAGAPVDLRAVVESLLVAALDAAGEAPATKAA